MYVATPAAGETPIKSPEEMPHSQRAEGTTPIKFPRKRRKEFPIRPRSAVISRPEAREKKKPPDTVQCSRRRRRAGRRQRNLANDLGAAAATAAERVGAKKEFKKTLKRSHQEADLSAPDTVRCSCCRHKGATSHVLRLN